MDFRQAGLAAFIVAGQVLWASAAPPLLPLKRSESAAASIQALDSLSAKEREALRHLTEKPLLSAKGPAETFACNPEYFGFFLDHPDRAVVAWRRLGAKCVNITARGGNLFGWSDDLGSDVVWETIHQGPGVRVWRAEGKIRPGPLLPLVPVRGLVILRFQEGKTAAGATVITHQAELFAHSDSKTAAVMARMMGPSASRMAEQGLAQLQLFFSGLCEYLERHPDRAERLLKAGD